MMNNTNINVEQENKVREILRSAEPKAVETIKEFFPELKSVNETWMSLYLVHRDIVLKHGPKLFTSLLEDLLDEKEMDNEYVNELKNRKKNIINTIGNEHLPKLEDKYISEKFYRFCNKAISDSLDYHKRLYDTRYEFSALNFEPS